MSATELIAALLFAAVKEAIPSYLEVDDDGMHSEAFYARCQMYVLAMGHLSDEYLAANPSWIR